MRTLAILVLSLAGAPALATDWPDLLGTWTGTSRAVVLGDGGHYAGEAGNPRFVEAELTIEWTDQRDGRYIGTISSAAHTEPKLAVLSADLETLITVDEDGSSIGRLIDDDRFELCYHQSSAGHTQMTASCVVFERQR